jgi:SAM-dependent methyltransferase
MRNAVGYTDDLAYIHNAGFLHFAERAAPGLLQLLRTHRIENGLIVDLGCGGGIWARRLLEAGYRVLGVDISESMIRIARKNAPGAKFLVDSLLTADLPECDAVTSIGECINYSFDTRNSAQMLAGFFRRTYAALRPGGLLIFDFLQPGQIKPGVLRRTHVLADDWAVLVDAEETETAKGKEAKLTRRITSFRRRGTLYRRTAETHEIQLFPAPQLTAALRKTGFSVRVLRGYGGFRLAPGHSVVVARKSSETRRKSR